MYVFRFSSININILSKKTISPRREAVDFENEVDNFNKSNDWLFGVGSKLKTPFYFNENHRQFYDCLKSSTTKMAFVDGPAGTMKTYIAVYAALEMIYDSLYDKLIYIRSVAESAQKSLGSLPGEVDDKFLPYAMPLLEKVQEITNNSTSNMLRQRGVIEAIPVNFVRGLTFNKSIVIVDEAQNLTKGELTTILTRFGRNSKYIIAGDCQQADIGNKTGFKDIFNKFNKDESVEKGIYSFKFSTSEIMRSKILKYICATLGS
jgi:phosphate starvation-inducible PhoH-like protein